MGDSLFNISDLQRLRYRTLRALECIIVANLGFRALHPRLYAVAALRGLMKQIRFILVVIALCAIVFVALRNYCPQSRVAFNKERREFQQLKNRTAFPIQSDFESGVTLATLLQPGDDRSRWANSRAAQLEGYVVAVYSGPLEAANCYCRRDIHIMIAPRPDS